jgi:hypothetical protein
MKRAIGLFIALLAACAAAYYGQALIERSTRHGPPPDVLKEWQTRSAAGLSFAAPADLKPESLDFGPIKQLLDDSEYYTLKRNGFEIGVIRSVFKPNIPVNIDNAVTGVVANISNLEGVQNMKHQVTGQTVSGKPARRVSMKADRWSGKIYNESLIILDGQTMYQLQASYDSSNPNGPSYAESVISSVKINP